MAEETKAPAAKAPAPKEEIKAPAVTRNPVDDVFLFLKNAGKFLVGEKATRKEILASRAGVTIEDWTKLKAIERIREPVAD